MGLVPFNAMAQQYIAAYPCAPGCLSRIANQFVAYSSVYLNTNARQNIKVDGDVVRQAVALDWAYHEVFIEREHFEEHTHWVHVSQESLTQLCKGRGN
jgi:hypothetical protein